jgi:hypothetical protein
MINLEIAIQKDVEELRILSQYSSLKIMAKNSVTILGFETG